MESIAKIDYKQIISDNLNTYSEVIFMLYKNNLISCDEYLRRFHSIDFNSRQNDIKQKMRSR